MIAPLTLAIDAATERLTVAVATGDRISSLHIDGPRRHAREALGMVDALLAELQQQPGDIGRVISGDGPGSFTGLRVANAVAKALVWGRPHIEWWTAPSLLARAVARVDRHAVQTVLAVSDALRGELYAGCWRFEGGDVSLVGAAPHALRPEALAGFGPVDVVVGTVPAALLSSVEQATGRRVIDGEAALPDARHLVELAAWRGALQRVGDAASWQPQYGRPVAAQEVWEAKHGRRLPDSTHRAG
jgi:tRNA threonylcarbamoyladenosine biosynthesis protein TsaB